MGNVHQAFPMCSDLSHPPHSLPLPPPPPPRQGPHHHRTGEGAVAERETAAGTELQLHKGCCARYTIQRSH